MNEESVVLVDEVIPPPKRAARCGEGDWTLPPRVRSQQELRRRMNNHAVKSSDQPTRESSNNAFTTEIAIATSDSISGNAVGLTCRQEASTNQVEKKDESQIQFQASKEAQSNIHDILPAENLLSNESQLQRPNPILNMTAAPYLHESQEIPNTSQIPVASPYPNIILNRVDANTSEGDGEAVDGSKLKMMKVQLEKVEDEVCTPPQKWARCGDGEWTLPPRVRAHHALRRESEEATKTERK